VYALVIPRVLQTKTRIPWRVYALVILQGNFYIIISFKTSKQKYLGEGVCLYTSPKGLTSDKL
jgi:hypothetical protein